jgi:hypothetical protein
MYMVNSGVLAFFIGNCLQIEKLRHRNLPRSWSRLKLIQVERESRDPILR